MDKPIVTLGGTVVAGANLYDWALTAGSRPFTPDFTMSVVPPGSLERYERLQGQRTHLKIEGPRRTLEADHIYVVGLYPGDGPDVRRLALADRRWLWPKTHISMSFNVRRATGDRFLLNDEVLENAVLQAREKYALWSLNNGAEHTAKSALGAVFRRLGQPWRFAEGTSDSTFNAVPIENLEIDDNGADAIERVLAYLPGANVYMGRDGVAVIYDMSRPPPSIRQEVQQVGGGFSAMGNLIGQRPEHVDVLFTREVEVRFNFRGDDSSASVSRDPDSNSLVNVVPVVASTLEVDGKTLAQGSWVPIDDWLAAIGPSPTGKTLTQKLIRQTFCNGRLGALVFYLLGTYPDPVWLRRLDMLRAHWRRTFQVGHTFWQRCAGLRPFRASILNYATGARAPSEAYCDYTRRPSVKAIDYTNSGNQIANIGYAVRGYADKIDDVRAAPVRVVIADPNAGVIALLPLVDPHGFVDEVTLGYPSGDALPSTHLGEANLSTQLGIYANWHAIILEDDWRLSVVMTTIPASPNSTDKFYTLRVAPRQTTFQLAAAECKGPPVQVRIFPGITTALMRWTDRNGNALVEAMKGQETGEGDERRIQWPEDNITNLEHLIDVAVAAASRVYEPLLDRPYGTATFDMHPDFELAGNMQSVRHAMQGAATTTTVSFGAPQQARNFWRYLNSSTRRAIMRNLNAGQEGVS